MASRQPTTVGRHAYRPAGRQRWLARLSLVAAAVAAVLLLVGGLKSLVVLLSGLVALVIILIAAWWFLSRRGVVRVLAAVLMIATAAAVLAWYAVHDVLWAVVCVAVLAAVTVLTAREALRRPRAGGTDSTPAAPPAQRPLLIMNPRSGGGKVGRFDIDGRARALGADVRLLDGPGHVDVTALARQGVDGGADLLGVAGGDGTQALVADVASRHGVPFVCISAGTRNHFAMDLGLDRKHPELGLEALRDGVDLWIDLGSINGRTFVNNASFGAYAEVVRSPAYRDDKRGTTLSMLPDLLSGTRGARLRVLVDGEPALDAPTALLVSNNPYDLADLAGLGARPRLDGGVLGVVGVTVDSPAQMAALLRGARGRGLAQTTARDVVVEADVPEIPVGVDGESLLMPTPVRCTIHPRALRVRVPRSRAAAPGAREAVDPARLLQLALR